MTLLTFRNKFVLQSTTPVSTSSSTLGDDSQASQIFTLDANQTVLVMYVANNNHLTAEDTIGTHIAINVDAVDVANSYDSPYALNYACRNTTFWIGNLAAGSHTIKGRFAANRNTFTVTISNRVLLVLVLNGNEFQYVDDATQQTTASVVLVDDPNASVTFTPSGNCVALYLYNCSNVTGTVESQYGKKAGINVAGTDFSQAEKSPYFANESDSVFSLYSASLTAVTTTVKGRFASNFVGSTVTISRRQLGVLLFDASTLMDIITSDIQVSTTSNSLVNDGQATISRITSDVRELLVIAMGTKRHLTTASSTGECYGINIDSVDRQISRGSPHGASSADSASTCYAQTTVPGSHTVQGRFSNNNDADSAIVDSRRVVALWMTITGIAISWMNA